MNKKKRKRKNRRSGKQCTRGYSTESTSCNYRAMRSRVAQIDGRHRLHEYYTAWKFLFRTSCDVRFDFRINVLCFRTICLIWMKRKMMWELDIDWLYAVPYTYFVLFSILCSTGEREHDLRGNYVWRFSEIISDIFIFFHILFLSERNWF